MKMKLSEKLAKVLEEKYSCRVVLIKSNGRVSYDDKGHGVFSWYAEAEGLGIVGSCSTMRECYKNRNRWKITHSRSTEHEIYWEDWETKGENNL